MCQSLGRLLSIESLEMSSNSPASASARNVLGEPLVVCGCEPTTGWHRNGFCETDAMDRGQHSICCVMTESFLRYSKAQGNDLSTPVPAFQFPGLKPGDHWCVCAPRWKQAYEDGMAPKVRLDATEDSALQVVSLEQLREHAHQSIS